MAKKARKNKASGIFDAAKDEQKYFAAAQKRPAAVACYSCLPLIGSQIRKEVPSPGMLLTSKRPWCFLTMMS